MESFKDWPEELEMKPQELAEAGFYHYPLDDYKDWVSDRIEPYVELQDQWNGPYFFS